MRTVKFALLIVFLLSGFKGLSHPSDALEGLSRTEISSVYLELGFKHIVPLGLDHILFIICLFLFTKDLKSMIWQATAFTLAHSITLGMAMFGVISTPSHIIEPVIALSIMYVALENILSEKFKSTRVIIVFLFGLIHGFGFAGVLTDLGLPKREFVNALICFNVGVELAQIAVILACWVLVGKWFHQKEWYRTRIVNPASAAIAVIALYWTIERIFFTA